MTLARRRPRHRSRKPDRDGSRICSRRCSRAMPKRDRFDALVLAAGLDRRGYWCCVPSRVGSGRCTLVAGLSVGDAASPTRLPSISSRSSRRGSIRDRRGSRGGGRRGWSAETDRGSAVTRWRASTLLRSCAASSRIRRWSAPTSSAGTGGRATRFAFKLDPHRISDLYGAASLPRDLGVPGRRLEGVHLCALRPGNAWRISLVGPGAGLPAPRCSGSASGAAGQSFAVIVPVGARASSSPEDHRLLDGSNTVRPRVAAYRTFVGRLLDLTDDIVEGVIDTAVDGRPRRRPTLSGGRRRQRHRDLLRHGQQARRATVFWLDDAPSRLRRVGRLRPQEDGDHRARHLRRR